MKTNQFNRQVVRSIVVDLSPANMGAGNEIEAKLPQGALLLRAGLERVIAFDSETTATAHITDGSTVFANAVSLKATGDQVLTGVPKYYPQGGKLTFSLAETGAAATEGDAFAYFEYIQRGVGDEVYG